MTKTLKRAKPVQHVGRLGIRRFEGYVLIHHDLCRHFDTQAARCSGQAEQGGALIGQFRGPHIEVSEYTMPGPMDQSRPTSFVKIDPYHQRAARQAWRLSGHTKTYVGEWHTHPEGHPDPSFTDRSSWVRVSRLTKTSCVFVIVAPNQWSLYVTEKKLVWSVTSLKFISDGQVGRVFGIP